MSRGESRREHGKGYAVEVTAAVIGLGYLVAGVLGDRVVFGIFGLVLMVAIGGLFWLVGRRSETVAGLSDGHDERINALNGQAAMIAGNVVLVACVVMLMVQIGRGADASPYASLAALGGISYVAALVWRLARG